MTDVPYGSVIFIYFSNVTPQCQFNTLPMDHISFFTSSHRFITDATLLLLFANIINSKCEIVFLSSGLKWKIRVKTVKENGLYI